MESHLRIDAFADTVDVRIGTIILYTEWLYRCVRQHYSEIIRSGLISIAIFLPTSISVSFLGQSYWGSAGNMALHKWIFSGSITRPLTCRTVWSKRSPHSLKILAAFGLVLIEVRYLRRAGTFFFNLFAQYNFGEFLRQVVKRNAIDACHPSVILSHFN